jgi:hypothetical protein
MQPTTQPARPGQTASGPDANGFIAGKQYKDKNGSTATYMGNGKWQ